MSIKISKLSIMFVAFCMAMLSQTAFAPRPTTPEPPAMPTSPSRRALFPPVQGGGIAQPMLQQAQPVPQNNGIVVMPPVQQAHPVAPQGPAMPAGLMIMAAWAQQQQA